VFYELLTYTEAFPGDNLTAITRRILNEEPVSLAHVVPDVSPEISAIIARTLKKCPADRFPDTESLRVAVNGARRAFSSNGTWTASVIASEDAPGTSGRGTGAARRLGDTPTHIAGMTPPPESRRSDRETLARRRLQQLEAALQQARTLFAQEQLDAALDACQQALTFDETHPAALKLEDDITQAIAAREATATGPTTKVAVAVPTPIRRPPDERQDEPAAPAPPLVDAPAPLMSQVKAPQPSARRASSPNPARKKRLIIAAAAIAGILAVVTAAMLGRPRPVATGTVVVNAAPWGTVTAIRTEKGEALTLPADKSTPLSLTLPPGTYRITVGGPPPDSQPQQVSVRVQAGGAAVAPVPRFPGITADEYFEPYLTRSAVAAAAVVPSTLDNAAPSAAPDRVR
jgi:hypothetical protein